METSCRGAKKLICGYRNERAVNSAGECHPHTVEVTGSNPVSPMKDTLALPGFFYGHVPRRKPLSRTSEWERVARRPPNVLRVSGVGNAQSQLLRVAQPSRELDVGFDPVSVRSAGAGCNLMYRTNCVRSQLAVTNRRPCPDSCRWPCSVQLSTTRLFSKLSEIGTVENRFA